MCVLQVSAIVGTDSIGSLLQHTLDIKNGQLFADGGVMYLCYIAVILLTLAVFSRLDILAYSQTLRPCCTDPYKPWMAGTCLYGFIGGHNSIF